MTIQGSPLPATDSDVLSRDEVYRLLERLWSDDELKRLHAVTRNYLSEYRLRGWEPADILQEAATRLLRPGKWPRDMAREPRWYLLLQAKRLCKEISRTKWSNGSLEQELGRVQGLGVAKASALGTNGKLGVAGDEGVATTFAAIESRDWYLKLDRALASSPTARAVLELKYIDGLELREIAVQLGLRIVEVESAARAIRRAQEKLAAEANKE